MIKKAREEKVLLFREDSLLKSKQRKVPVTKRAPTLSSAENSFQTIRNLSRRS